VGQRIQVQPTIVDTTAIFDTDRSITGQNGISYASLEDAEGDHRFPGRLAKRILESDGAIESVWVASNTIIVKRGDGWTDAASVSVSDVIEGFFLYY